MDKVLTVRLLIEVVFFVAAVLAWTQDYGAGVKAPILTFLGGAMVVVWFLPSRRAEWRDVIVVLGTGVATVGSWYWLMDATVGDPDPVILPVLASVMFVATVLVVIFIVRIFERRSDYPVGERREIERTVRKRLGDLVDEARYAGGPGSSGSQIYEAYDGTMLDLFVHTWSMSNVPRRWTYEPKNHKDLLGNYIVARLEKTAEIAISKHPHQCKYGAAADNLAYYARRYLSVTRLITEFDPLPQVCPECAEPKPSHKANCMAAICWQCKFPTPPRDLLSQKTEVVTPQCHVGAACIPRGELVSPAGPVVTRIRLPFSVPHAGEDDCMPASEWPRNRQQLRDLLNQLNHD